MNYRKFSHGYTEFISVSAITVIVAMAKHNVLVFANKIFVTLMQKKITLYFNIFLV